MYKVMYKVLHPKMTKYQYPFVFLTALNKCKKSGCSIIHLTPSVLLSFDRHGAGV